MNAPVAAGFVEYVREGANQARHKSRKRKKIKDTRENERVRA